ncbi:hypothetical protein PQR67_22285 [Paraburkholderia fungorum]|uniref:hypothetical protein n=1 Tax=Paraburkholderia fungorum TaxID=134537 RepID=UPI0038BD2C2C
MARFYENGALLEIVNNSALQPSEQKGLKEILLFVPDVIDWAIDACLAPRHVQGN